MSLCPRQSLSQYIPLSVSIVIILKLCLNLLLSRSLTTAVHSYSTPANMMEVGHPSSEVIGQKVQVEMVPVEMVAQFGSGFQVLHCNEGSCQAANQYSYLITEAITLYCCLQEEAMNDDSMPSVIIMESGTIALTKTLLIRFFKMKKQVQRSVMQRATIHSSFFVFVFKGYDLFL